MNIREEIWSWTHRRSAEKLIRKKNYKWREESEDKPELAYVSYHLQLSDMDDLPKEVGALLREAASSPGPELCETEGGDCSVGGWSRWRQRVSQSEFTNPPQGAWAAVASNTLRNLKA